MAKLIQLGETPASATPSLTGCALWNLGFRPFYLLAGVFSALAVAVWVAHFSGLMMQGTWLRDPLWHAHEMIFGYTFAVVVGFLFTAVRNWTGLPTPTGAALAAIAALWLAARLAFAGGWIVPGMAFDFAFALAAAGGIARPLIASGNRRNLFFIALLLAMGVANLCFVLALSGELNLPPRRMLTLALDLVLFVMVVMGGRVIPMFTANAVPQAKPVRPEWIERMAPASVLGLLVADLLALPAMATAAVAAAAALIHGLRLYHWHPWHTRQRPILWILHLSYGWLVLHLLLRAYAPWDAAAVSLATHALTVGGIGGLTLGMMTRTARGHTGRLLTTGRAELAAYLLVQLAAVVRVLLPLAAPAFYLTAIAWSGGLWVAAFAIFVVAYAPILWRPRIDGQPG